MNRRRLTALVAFCLAFLFTYEAAVYLGKLQLPFRLGWNWKGDHKVDWLVLAPLALSTLACLGVGSFKLIDNEVVALAVTLFAFVCLGFLAYMISFSIGLTF